MSDFDLSSLVGGVQRYYCPKCQDHVDAGTLHCLGKCNRHLPLDQFDKDARQRGRLGRSRRCKDERRAYQRAYYGASGPEEPSVSKEEPK
jgi:hypothetical protein